MPSQRRDLYALLGVLRNASTDEVRRAYRERALRSHPDLHDGDPDREEELKRINRAYEVLTDPGRRALYDEFGEAGLRPGFDAESQRLYRRWQPPGVQPSSGWSGNLGDLFPKARRAPTDEAPVFGDRDVDAFLAAALERKRRARASERPGAPGDGALEVELSLRDALAGAERSVQITPDQRLRVRLPAGVRDGERLRVPGGRGGEIWVRVRVRPHPRIRRDGDDLRLALPLTLGEAWRGAEVRVPSLDGEARVVVPAGTRTGDEVVVTGAGAPGRDGGRGDLLVTFEVCLPAPGAAAEAAFRAVDRLYGPGFRADVDW